MKKFDNGTYRTGTVGCRSRAEIKEDIRCISERIAEVNAELNIRELISDVFDTESFDIIKRAQSITELLKYAEEALSELRSLNEQLEELRCELISSTDMCMSYERGDF